MVILQLQEKISPLFEPISLRRRVFQLSRVHFDPTSDI